MDIGETLYVTDRTYWREWLEANFDTKQEVWLVYPNKAAGEPRILYNDAVKEALCFGWIDSIIKKLNEVRAAQRFTPRKAGSGYSQPTRERLSWLASEGLLHPSIRGSGRGCPEGRVRVPSGHPAGHNGQRAGVEALSVLL